MANLDNQEPQAAISRQRRRLHFIHRSPGLWCLLLSTILVLVSGVIGIAQQRPMKLAKIQVEGLQRLSSEEVVTTSGLKLNESYDVDELDAAAKRLVESGLFKNVAYGTRTVSGLTTITFQVEELKGGASPITFDNFVWFTEQELVDAIRKELTAFTGTAPDTGNTTDRIKQSLQILLEARKLPGTVEYMPSLNERTRTQEHLFTVTGVRIPVCSMRFTGAQAVSEQALVKTSREFTGSNYSRQGVGAFATARLFPLYRDVGHLRATFGKPTAKLVGSSDCKSGVELTMPVEEGPLYFWDKAEWSGNRVMSVAALDTALGMKSGEPASGSKYDKALENVRRAYGRKGHLMATYREQLQFDDAARRVTTRIEVSEGPQFRMGNLVVKGFSEGEERYLRETWRLNSGDVFDQGYMEEYLKNSFPTAMNSLAQRYRAENRDLPKKVETGARPDRRTLTVEVTLGIVDN